MLCEDCGRRDATCTVTVMTAEGRSVRRLCPECMARMNAGLTGGNVRDLLSVLLRAMPGGAQEAPSPVPTPPEDTAEDPLCPGCGLRRSALRRSGRLGCAACYTAFREDVIPLLTRLQGAEQHMGRRPPVRGQAPANTLADDLSRRLAQAVAEEDYETAAALRDQLRAIAPDGGDEA